MSALTVLSDRLARGEDLASANIATAVHALTDPQESDATKATFLRALRAKGETVEEIAGFAEALLARALDPEIDLARLPGPSLDVCGTGGDRLGLFNVSTTASFVLAAGGAAVIKHGNRAVTSRSGGTDVLHALGMPVEHPASHARKSLENVGLCFLLAPQYHPAVAAVGAVRKQLAAEGTSTIFNLLGPLLNPVRPTHQLTGVFSVALTEKYAQVLQRLGRKTAWAVHGAGGMDEMSTLGETQVSFSTNQTTAIATRQIVPEDAGLPRLPDIAHVRGGTADDNARTLIGILASEITGPPLDIVLLNAAAGFVVAGLTPDLGTGVERAREAIKSGRALRVLRYLQDTGG